MPMKQWVGIATHWLARLQPSSLRMITYLGVAPAAAACTLISVPITAAANTVSQSAIIAIATHGILAILNLPEHLGKP